MHIGIFGFEPILHHGSEDLKRRFLPRVSTGDLQISFAVTEPDAGTDTTNLTTFATKVDGGWLVSGKKVWISNAQQAERMLLLARTTPKDECAKKTDGLTVFFAPIDREKVTIRSDPQDGSQLGRQQRALHRRPVRGRRGRRRRGRARASR